MNDSNAVGRTFDYTKKTFFDMKLNEKTKIVGKKVILIPYEAKHVEKYHKWMENPELRELTASEPLSLADEYEMQKSWRNDDDKLTFLIVSQRLFNETQHEIDSLVGDTNLFLRVDDDENEECNQTVKIAEAEIMIAEHTARGLGLGWEAMLLLIKYAQKNLSIDKFEVKIGIDNVKSISMFNKMKFVEISRSSVFNEVTMERPVTGDWICWLNEQVQLNVEKYQ